MSKKILLPFVFLSLLPLSALADDSSGFYLGGGFAATTDDNYSDADTKGYAIEAGFKLNKIVAFEAKLSEATYDNYDVDLSMSYAGVNLGGSFGADRFSAYGKIGYANAEISDGGGSDSNPALGAGFSFAPNGNEKGVFFKAELLRMQFFESYSTFAYAGVGYKF